MIERRRKCCFGLWVAALLIVPACASNPAEFESTLTQSLETRLDFEDNTAATTPSDSLADGLDQREAVVLALRNSPSFRASLAELAVAEADLYDAMRPANPTLQLIDPVGAGVLEGALAIPIDLLRRPARVGAARASLRQATLNQVQAGLALARDVIGQFAAVSLAEDRAAALADDAQALDELARILEKKADLGRGTGLDAAAARAAALDRRSDADVAAADLRAARTALSALIGIDVAGAALVRAPFAVNLGSVPAADDLLAAALETRPDIIAADLAVEAAAKNRSGAFLEVLKPGAYVDLGKEQGENLKVSGGGTIDLPIFNQGVGAQKRADARLKRALAERDGVRLKVAAEIASAHDAFLSAAAAVDRIEKELLPAAKSSADYAQKAFDLGRSSLTDVLAARRALNSARIKRAEAVASQMRANAALNYSTGRELFSVKPASLEDQ